MAFAASARVDAAPFFAYIVAERVFQPALVNPRLIEVDTTTGAPTGEAIAIGSMDDEPTGTVAISPGGRYVYAGIGHFVVGTPSGYDDHRVAVVDTKARKLVNTLPVSDPRSPAGTGGMAVTPDGGTLYAYRGYDLTLATHAIAVFAVPGGALRALVALPFGAGSRAIAVSPDGGTVVSLSYLGVTFIDRETNTVSATLRTGDPRAVGFSPDGATLYVVTSGQLLRIDVKRRLVQDAITLGPFPGALAVSPAGHRLYLINGLSNGKLLVIDTDLWQIAAEVSVGDNSRGVAVTPDGDQVYVTLYNEPVVLVLSTATNSVVGRIDGLGPALNGAANFIGPKSAALQESVEFFHRAFEHYFTTNNSVEIDMLDAGDFNGWERTGGRFNVFLAPFGGRRSVCRFFSNAFSGKSSHFFAPRGFGCEEAIGNADWHYEGDMYYVQLPGADGTCPVGTEPIYRLYNNGQGGAPNHRFTRSLSERQTMLARGWIAEGSGVGIGMCGPAK